MAGRKDHGDYLVSMRGAGEELVGEDLDEIVVRTSHLGEGSATLRELAGHLRTEADRYERLAEEGWALTAPIADGVGHCRQNVQPGAPSDAPPVEGMEGPPASLADLLEGAATLPEAAARLRSAAAWYVAAHDNGQRLAVPVEHGRTRLR